MKPALSIFLLTITLSLYSCQLNSANDSTQRQKYDWECIPGQKVGAINAHTTEAKLKEIYGGDQVVRDSLHVNKGVYVPSTKIFPNTSNELRIAWKEDAFFKKIARVIIEQPNTNWETQSGITIGTPLSKLTKLNRTDFYFYGFNSPYSGSLSSWEDGDLQNDKLGMRLSYKGDMSQVSAEDLSKVMTEAEISSAELTLEKMQVEVSHLYFFF